MEPHNQNNINHHKILTIIVSIFVIVIGAWVVKVMFDNYRDVSINQVTITEENSDLINSLSGKLYISAISANAGNFSLTNIFTYEPATDSLETLTGGGDGSDAFAYSLTRPQNSLDNYVMLPTDEMLLETNKLAPYRLRHDTVTGTYSQEILDVEFGMFSHTLKVNRDNSAITFTTIMPEQFDVLRGDVSAWTVVVKSLDDEFETIYLAEATNPAWLLDTVVGYVRAEGIYGYDVTTGEERLLVSATDLPDVAVPAMFKVADTMALLPQVDNGYLVFSSNALGRLYMATITSDGTVSMQSSYDFARPEAIGNLLAFSLVTVAPDTFAFVTRATGNAAPSSINFYQITNNNFDRLLQRPVPEFIPGSVVADFWQPN